MSRRPSTDSLDKSTKSKPLMLGLATFFLKRFFLQQFVVRLKHSHFWTFCLQLSPTPGHLMQLLVFMCCIRHKLSLLHLQCQGWWYDFVKNLPLHRPFALSTTYVTLVTSRDKFASCVLCCFCLFSRYVGIWTLKSPYSKHLTEWRNLLSITRASFSSNHSVNKHKCNKNEDHKI